MNGFSEIELFESPKRFVLVPKKVPKDRLIVEKTNSDYNNVLIIDRVNGKLDKFQVKEKDEKLLFKPMKTMIKIQGILGIIELLAGPYLVVILEREFVGYLKNHKIYLLKKIQMIPFTPSKFHKLEDSKKTREISYIEMIHQIYVLDTSFYFSYTFDLTLSIQDQRDSSDWRKSSEDFFWNKNFNKQLISSNADGYILPMIRGLVEIVKTKVNNKLVYYGIISRIGCGRVGTRFNCRGSNLKGDVANFVETEQFIIHDTSLSSFVQVRGSIPLLWTQYANLKYTPEIKFSEKDPKKHREAFVNHFTKLIQKRGKVSILALTKKSSHEKVITETYERFLQKTKFSPEVKYFYFDFHHETKGLNLEKTNILIDRVKQELIDMSYYKESFKAENNTEMKIIEKMEPIKDIKIVDEDPEDKESLETSFSLDVDLLKINEKDEKKEEDMLKLNEKKIEKEKKVEEKKEEKKNVQLQSGLFRINCIDCCDRTNVVMTYVARRVLKAQMVELFILESNSNLTSSFLNIFNHLWANNGDAISRLYAGTTALMGDYTRSGERTISGLLNDGYNSAMRYVQNNFKDTEKQRAIDLSLGRLDIYSKSEEELSQKTEIISDILLF